MTDADLAEWEAWVAGRNDRRTAASVAAALENSKPPRTERVGPVEAHLVLEVVYVDELDGARYRRTYPTLESAKRGAALIDDQIRGRG